MNLIANTKENTGLIKSMKIKFNFDEMKWEGINIDQVKLWEKLYPGVNVVNEITVEMIRWLDKVKGTKKANKKNWKAFIVKWLKREQMKSTGII